MLPLATTVLLCLLGAVVSESEETEYNSYEMISDHWETTLRIMSFNTWNSGKHVEHGLYKIVKQIKSIDPDIVALQEIESQEHLDNITKMLGHRWKGYMHMIGYPDTGIISKHHIFADSVSQSDMAIGAKISIPLKRQSHKNVNISFWSIHTDPSSYGPYAACNKFVFDHSQIMAGEMELGKYFPGRFQNARDLLTHPEFERALQASNREAVILAGDFNSPSHLDWTEKTKEKHCGWSFRWPTTVIFVEEGEMIDSFRYLHPNPLTHPGNTWSTVQKFTDQGWGWTIDEPQDRIDMILYRGNSLHPIKAYSYQGHYPVHRKPKCYKNQYPSDHAAVITEFTLSN